MSYARRGLKNYKPSLLIGGFENLFSSPVALKRVDCEMDENLDAALRWLKANNLNGNISRTQDGACEIDFTPANIIVVFMGGAMVKVITTSFQLRQGVSNED